MFNPCDDPRYVVTQLAGNIARLLADMDHDLLVICTHHLEVRQIITIVEPSSMEIAEDPESCRELMARLARFNLLLTLLAAAVKEQARECKKLPVLARRIIL